MSSTAKLAAAVAALIMYGGSVSATPLAAHDAPQPPSATAPGGAVIATRAAAPQPAGAMQFGGDPCQVSPEIGLELVELGAFDEWQGARTTPEGNAEALRFGALVEEAVAAELTGTTPEPGREMQERRRMFVLGLAILLNLNTNR